ncbi:MAG: biopolymer transporter ExbD [Candidatus Azobacteroides sp.]|nr:biopolymer transporter ExbD [Candidatus Azobacteroides sp.]
MARFKREVPQLSSTSSADVAFILLLFFLLSGSLDSKSGIYRRLAPPVSETAIKKKNPIEERNMLTVTIQEDNTVYLKEEPVSISEIRKIAKVFIDNPDNKDFLPRKTALDIPGLGTTLVSRDAVINLEFSRKSNYQTYISVLSELTAAYDELRKESAFGKFSKPFSDLSEEQQAGIREMYPLRISEKEIPENQVSHE